MDKKNSVIIILVLVVLVLGYVIYADHSDSKFDSNTNIQTEVDTSEKEEGTFAQNQSCLQYKEEIENKLETKDSPFGDTSLEQIFYSPREHSCLYVEYSVDDGFYNRRLLDIRNDGYNSNPLEACIGAISSPSQQMRDRYINMYGDLSNYQEDLDACKNFDSILAEYK